MKPNLPITPLDLLRQRNIEGERIEPYCRRRSQPTVKAGWNPEAVLHSMCAFANDFHNGASG